MGDDCGAAATCRGLKRLGITRKMSRRAAEQDYPDLKAEREAWREVFAEVDPPRLIEDPGRRGIFWYDWRRPGGQVR